MKDFLAFLTRRRKRIEQAEQAAAEADQIKSEIDAQWPEVHELSAWARDIPQRPDDLTRLFKATLGGHA